MVLQILNRRTLAIFSIVVWATSCELDNEIETPAFQELDRQLAEALNAADPVNGVSGFILPDEGNFSEIPQDPRNPITSDKVALGQLLFHETGLAIDAKNVVGIGTYSCASCHNPAAAFQPGRRQGIADGGLGFGIIGEGRGKDEIYPDDSLDVQPIKVPSTLNVAYQKNLLWNGQFGATGDNTGTEHLWEEDELIATNFLGFEGAETQAIAGLTFHRKNITMEFAEQTGYLEMFRSAFPGISDEELINKEFAGLAIASYVRTLLSNEAPFQRFLKGESTALTIQQKRGALLFFDKAKCSNCHSGPALNSMRFEAVGMGDLEGPEIFNPDKQAGLGRASFTGEASDEYKFKVPQLYNLQDAGFLGHGGTFNTLREVVEYFNTAEKQNPEVPDSQLAEDFEPLFLSDDEVEDLVAFLEDGLHDVNLERFVPSSILSGNCFPNNDEQSRTDLNCN
ncbi:MAG: cytochrome c peroxidase [Bacteroidota bacterium]